MLMARSGRIVRRTVALNDDCLIRKPDRNNHNIQNPMQRVGNIVFRNDVYFRQLFSCNL